MGLQWQVRYLLCERMKFIGITVEECNLGFTFRIGGWIVSHIKCRCPQSSPLEKLQSWWYYCQWQWNIKKTTFDNSFYFLSIASLITLWPSTFVFASKIMLFFFKMGFICFLACNHWHRQEAAGALWNLSFDDRNREAIAAAGGVEALVRCFFWSCW